MRACAFLVIFSSAVSAAPMLRLENSVVTAQVAVGANAAAQTVGVTNAGDGTLSPTVMVSPQTWLSAAYLDAFHFIQFVFSTSKLAAGNYTARVTVPDPNAVDSPQVVIVTLQVGPTPIDQYLAPGTQRSIPIPGVSGICLASCATVTATTSDGGGWLKASTSYR